MQKAGRGYTDAQSQGCGEWKQEELRLELAACLPSADLLRETISGGKVENGRKGPPHLLLCHLHVLRGMHTWHIQTHTK